MNRLASGKKRIIALLLVVMMTAVLALGAIPASAEGRCLVFDDHGNCLLWLSQANVSAYLAADIDSD